MTTIRLCKNRGLSNFCIERYFQSIPVVAFDFEWEVSYRPPQLPISLIQLCSWESTALIQLDTKEPLNFPEKLRELFENPDIVKVGHYALNDAIKLYRDYNIKMTNILDTRDFANVHFNTKAHIKLKDLAKKMLDIDLDKSPNIRLGKWNGILSEEQKAYAAADVQATWGIYQKFMQINPELAQKVPKFCVKAHLQKKQEPIKKGTGMRNVTECRDYFV